MNPCEAKRMYLRLKAMAAQPAALPELKKKFMLHPHNLGVCSKKKARMRRERCIKSRKYHKNEWERHSQECCQKKTATINVEDNAFLETNKALLKDQDYNQQCIIPNNVYVHQKSKQLGGNGDGGTLEIISFTHSVIKLFENGYSRKINVNNVNLFFPSTEIGSTWDDTNLKNYYERILISNTQIDLDFIVKKLLEQFLTVNTILDNAMLRKKNSNEEKYIDDYMTNEEQQYIKSYTSGGIKGMKKYLESMRYYINEIPNLDLDEDGFEAGNAFGIWYRFKSETINVRWKKFSNYKPKQDNDLNHNIAVALYNFLPKAIENAYTDNNQKLKIREIIHNVGWITKLVYINNILQILFLLLHKELKYISPDNFERVLNPFNNSNTFISPEHRSKITDLYELYSLCRILLIVYNIYALDLIDGSDSSQNVILGKYISILKIPDINSLGHVGLSWNPYSFINITENDDFYDAYMCDEDNIIGWLSTNFPPEGPPESDRSIMYTDLIDTIMKKHEIFSDNININIIHHGCACLDNDEHIEKAKQLEKKGKENAEKYLLSQVPLPMPVGTRKRKQRHQNESSAIKRAAVDRLENMDDMDIDL